MKQFEYERILGALNELSLYVFECMQKDYSQQDEKALNNKRLLNLQQIPPDEREKEAIKKILSLASPDDVAPLRNNLADSQLNFNVRQQSKSFGDKEIDMLLNVPGVSINKKPRSDGRFQGYITINGSKHYVYGKTPKDVATKIQLVLNHGIPKRKTKVINGVPITFDSFSQYYFKNFREKKVAVNTLRADLSRYNTHIKPYFKEKL